MNKSIVYLDDLDENILNKAYDYGIVSMDIETTGLDWENETIGLCQIFIPDDQIFLVKPNDNNIHIIRRLLEDNNIAKIFHHAMFDLRFMSYQWNITPSNVLCTKICSKILFPENKTHDLKSLLKNILNISIEKRETKSNWLSDTLTKSQINYAVNDVIYLPNLFNELKSLLIQKNKWYLTNLSFSYIPTRVKLDILKIGDVFTY